MASDNGHDVWNGPSFEATRRAIVQGLYPRGCDFCLRSLVAPASSQLGELIGSYVDWYQTAHGVDLPFTSPAMRSNDNIVSALAGLVEFQKPVAQHGAPADPFAQGVLKGSGPARVVGHIDNVGPEGVWGWFMVPSRPKSRLKINLYLNGQFAGSALAVAFRQDLKTQNIGDGCSGFYLSGHLVPRGCPINAWVEVPELGYRSPTFRFAAAA